MFKTRGRVFYIAATAVFLTLCAAHTIAIFLHGQVAEESVEMSIFYFGLALLCCGKTKDALMKNDDSEQEKA